MSVIPTQKRDYPEWHRGRSVYGLWYIEIIQPELLAYLNRLRQQFSPFLFTPNTRQFHISLYICGFLTEAVAEWDDDFTHSQLYQQVNMLREQLPASLTLTAGSLNSFESALFVEVQDHGGMLQQLRKNLQALTVEIAPVQYCPHITLGLYKEAFPAQQILQQMLKIEQQQFCFPVDQLTFGYYEAQVLQGHLYPHTQLQLGEACCN